MDESERQRLHDEWAPYYDESVASSTTSTGFPFAGYEAALSAAAEMAGPRRGERVLDLGTGTGRLAALFAERECVVTAIDLSPGMLAQAAKRLPSATLLRLDLLGDWSPLAGQRFDVIASGYVFHEFDDAMKIALLMRLRDDHLNDGGRIVVADIAFETRADLERIRAVGEAWDESESYWVEDEMVAALGSAGMPASVRRVSICAAVFRLLP